MRNKTVHHEVVPIRSDEHTIGFFNRAMFNQCGFNEERTVFTLYVHDHTEKKLPIVGRLRPHVKELGELVSRWERRMEEVRQGE